jgi:hypothetical protein
MKLRFVLHVIIALCVGLLLPTNSAKAQAPGDSALLDALVKKGVLSDQEAEDIRAQDEKDWSSTSASKINLATSIKTITFYGDLRLRYELRDGTVQAGDTSGAGVKYTHDDSQTRSRWRYRLRFGLKGDLYDNFFYGIRVASGFQNDRSGNVTFGDTDNGGVFGNTKSLLGIDRVYLGWKPTDWLTLTGGKMENPFYTTNLVWDDNLSPAGAAEQFDYKATDNLEVFATAGQFVYGDSADNAAFTGAGANYDDIFMFGEQVGFKYKFDDNTFYKAGASIFTYSGSVQGAATTVTGLYSTNPINYNNNTSTSAENNSPGLYNGPFVGAASAPESNVSGINNLAVLEFPMEFDWKVGKVPMRVFGDFAYNLEADERANAARNAINSAVATGVSNTGVTAIAATTKATTITVTPVGGGAPVAVPTGGLTTTKTAAANTAALVAGSNGFQGVLNSGKGLLDQCAYQVGYEAGQLKKKGDWDGKLYWQSTGYYAVDPNLIDADIFNASTNLQGVVVQLSHNWTDGLTSTVKYAYATPVNDKMATPNFNQDLQISAIHEYNLFQADLMWKF